MRISLILAVSRNGVIGRDGAIPWRVPSDMQRFRALTMGKPMVMGRKQYESVGRPLRGRENIVITRNRQWTAPGVQIASSLDDALSLARRAAERLGTDEIMVIGGAQIYALALPLADRIYLSRIEVDVDGDVRFELGNLTGWTKLSSETIAARPQDDFGHTFCVLERT